MAASKKVMMLRAMRERSVRDRQKRMCEDFEYFGESVINILPKDISLELIPLVLNEAQTLIHQAIEKQKRETGKVRVIVLKARQQGISTYFAARTYWNTVNRKYVKATIIAQDKTTTEALFDMTKRFYENHPEDMGKPPTKYSSKQELVFDTMKSKYSLATAGSKDAGRGTTPTSLHASEVAFWGKAESILAGLFQGVPNVDGTEIIMESTANGAQGEFHRLWQEAVAGRGPFIAVFAPWFITREYTRDVPEDFERTYEEQELVDAYGLSDGQLMFRRDKISEGGIEKFMQEYPSTADEAFLRTGSSVFDLSKLDVADIIPTVCKEVYSPSPRNSFDLDGISGDLELWEYPSHDGRYLIGADVSFGVGQDYSCAVIMTEDKRIIGMFRSNRIQPTDFGEMLFYLGRRFNNCLIVCERNGPGLATLNHLNDLGYINIYFETKVYAISNLETTRPGFTTTGSTKSHLIAGLARCIREHSIELPSAIMHDEIKNYIALDGGKMEAASGYHDDTIISLALCIEGLRTHSHKLSKIVDWGRYKGSDYVDSTNWM